MLLSDDDLMFIDSIVARIKEFDYKLFQVLKWRYVYGYSYREITKQLKKRSPKVAGAILEKAENKYMELIK